MEGAEEVTYQEAVKQTLVDYARDCSGDEPNLQFLQMFLADVEFKLLESKKK